VGFGSHSHGVLRRDDAPDWANQLNRFLTPCKNNDAKHWFRRAKGISLGQLFYHHGDNWSSSGLYAFYKSCRVLAVKQKYTQGAAAQYTPFMKHLEIDSLSLSLANQSVGLM
jgi:hypothetical protein